MFLPDRDTGGTTSDSNRRKSLAATSRIMIVFRRYDPTIPAMSKYIRINIPDSDDLLKSN